MAETLIKSRSSSAIRAGIAPRRKDEPKGVIRKGMKPMIYLGAATLVITAAIFSSSGKKAMCRHSRHRQTAKRHSRRFRTTRTTMCRTLKVLLPSAGGEAKERLRHSREFCAGKCDRGAAGSSGDVQGQSGQGTVA